MFAGFAINRHPARSPCKTNRNCAVRVPQVGGAPDAGVPAENLEPSLYSDRAVPSGLTSGSPAVPGPGEGMAWLARNGP